MADTGKLHVQGEASAHSQSGFSMRKTVLLRHSVPAPESLKGLKIAFLSDVHVSGFRKPGTLRSLMSAVQALDADLILWGGDFAESERYQRAFFEAAACLRPRLGSFAVMGNNDSECFHGASERMRALAHSAGIRLLINEQASIPIGTGRILIAGLDDWKYGSPKPRGLFRGAGKDDLRILLAHYPHMADKALKQAAQPPHLCLSGHTHGGQIRLFGRTCFDLGYGRRYAKRYAHFLVSGYREFVERLPDGSEHIMRVLVSNGLGESLIPVRVCAPRQYHLITLV